MLAPDFPLPLAPDLRRIPAECVALFRESFAGREDEWWRVREDGTPFPLTEPARVEGQPVPLDAHHLSEHLAGTLHVAVDPVRPDGTVRFAVVVLDAAAAPWKLEALRLHQVARSLGIPLLLERPRSGRGVQAWILFADPVPASDARRLCMALLSAAGEGDPSRMRSFDRLLPADPTSSRGADSGAVPLPLQGSLRSRNLTVFVHPRRGLPPQADQWAVLAMAPRMRASDLRATLHRSLGGDAAEIGPSDARSALAPASSRAPLRGLLSASLALPRPLPGPVATLLREALVVPNPVYERRREQALGLHGVPRLHAAFRRQGAGWLVPRNAVGLLRTACDGLGIAFELGDARCRLKAAPMVQPAGLEAPERHLLDRLLLADFSTLELDQSLARTLVTLAAVAARGVPTLLVASSQARLEQWREQAMVWLGIEDIATLEPTSQAPPEALLTLSTYATVAGPRPPAGLENHFGHLVLDDCARAPVADLRRVAERVPATYVLGLKDGPRRDGLDRLVALYVGPTLQRQEAGAPPLVDVVLRYTDFERPLAAVESPRARQWSALLEALSHDPARNALVAGDVVAEARGGASCLVYTARREHALALREVLAPRIDLALAMGSLPPAQRTEALRRFRDREVPVLVVTEQLIGAGFDCPHLARVFLASPIMSEGQLRQYLTPLTRHPQERGLPRVYDYIDDRVDILAAKGRARRRFYRRENTTLNFDAMQLRLPFPD